MCDQFDFQCNQDRLVLNLKVYIMTTFVLKKYQEKTNSTNNDSSDNTQESKTEELSEDLTIKIEGSVSEIVAQALYKAMKNQVEITEIADNEETDVKAITTEAINNNPIDVFKSIKQNDVVFISNHGFTTAKEEWFLTNIANKTSSVFYTVESFIRYISNHFGIQNAG